MNSGKAPGHHFKIHADGHEEKEHIADEYWPILINLNSYSVQYFNFITLKLPSYYSKNLST